MNYILNGLSLNMLSPEVAELQIIKVRQVESDMVYDESGMDIFHFADTESAIGHADTAALIAKTFGLDPVVVRFNRATVELQPGDRALIFSYKGPRLPEGATTLPAGAVIVPQVVVAIGAQPAAAETCAYCGAERCVAMRQFGGESICGPVRD